MMLKYYVALCVALIASESFAKPCTFTGRSCLKLNNQYSQPAKINCQWLESVVSDANAQNSIQLDLAFGDGLGAPEPRNLNCTLTTGAIKKAITFYNPYWGSVIEFNLASEKKLEVRAVDGWSSKQVFYSFTW